MQDYILLGCRWQMQQTVCVDTAFGLLSTTSAETKEKNFTLSTRCKNKDFALHYLEDN